MSFNFIIAAHVFNLLNSEILHTRNVSQIGFNYCMCPYKLKKIEHIANNVAINRTMSVQIMSLTGLNLEGGTGKISRKNISAEEHFLFAVGEG